MEIASYHSGSHALGKANWFLESSHITATLSQHRKKQRIRSGLHKHQVLCYVDQWVRSPPNLFVHINFLSSLIHHVSVLGWYKHPRFSGNS